MISLYWRTFGMKFCNKDTVESLPDAYILLKEIVKRFKKYTPVFINGSIGIDSIELEQNHIAFKMIAFEKLIIPLSKTDLILKNQIFIEE